MQRDLVERAMVGDRDAFAELQRGQIDRLCAIARLILRDDDRAHDATREAPIAAWRDTRGLTRWQQADLTILPQTAEAGDLSWQRLAP